MQLTEWGRRRASDGRAGDPCQPRKFGTRGRRGSTAKCAGGFYSKDEFKELTEWGRPWGLKRTTPAGCSPSALMRQVEGLHGGRISGSS